MADQHALDVEQMYRRYSGLVLRRIHRFYRGDEAEEVLQEVFVRVLKTRSAFRGASSPSTWLYQLATRHCLNRLRDADRRRELLDHHGEPGWGTSSPAVDPETSVFLTQVFDQLEPELAEIGVYHFVDGLPHAEIARIIGVSRRTVGNRVATLQEVVARAADKTQEAR